MKHLNNLTKFFTVFILVFIVMFFFSCDAKIELTVVLNGPLSKKDSGKLIEMFSDIEKSKDFSFKKIKFRRTDNDKLYVSEKISKIDFNSDFFISKTDLSGECNYKDALKRFECFKKKNTIDSPIFYYSSIYQNDSNPWTYSINELFLKIQNCFKTNKGLSTIHLFYYAFDCSDIDIEDNNYQCELEYPIPDGTKLDSLNPTHQFVFESNFYFLIKTPEICDGFEFVLTKQKQDRNWNWYDKSEKYYFDIEQNPCIISDESVSNGNKSNTTKYHSKESLFFITGNCNVIMPNDDYYLLEINPFYICFGKKQYLNPIFLRGKFNSKCDLKSIDPTMADNISRKIKKKISVKMEFTH